MRDAVERHQRMRALFDEALLQDPLRPATPFSTAPVRPISNFGLTSPGCWPPMSVRTSFLERPTWRPLLPPAGDDDEFRGTARFTVRRRLGVGGMGVVYEVDDTARHEIVALKTLRRTTAADIYRLKREFRSLADVVHPNLVSLYELFADDDQCFFTMELVPGAELRRLRPRHGRSRAVPTSAWSRRFGNWWRASSALHRIGKLHRDIKPSNVLVTPDGRVVILDFGLVHRARASKRLRRRRPAASARRPTWRPKRHRASARRRPATGTPSASCCSRR